MILWLTADMTITPVQAADLASALDLDVHEVGVCHACLCIVSFAIDKGDERDIRRTVAQIAPDLWHDGLALPLRAALERARRRGVATAAAAIEEVERRGPRSAVVRAVVRRLAADLLAEMDLPPHAPVVALAARRGR